MTQDQYVMLFQFGIFLVMIPITFKILNGLNLDLIFKRGHVWEKQSFFLVMTVVLSYLFARAFSDLVALMNAL